MTPTPEAIEKALDAFYNDPGATWSEATAAEAKASMIRALAAYDSAMEAAGFVRVPVEPTEAMLANTVDEKGTIRVLDFTTPEERGKAFLMPRYVYRAMIAARPTTPQDMA